MASVAYPGIVKQPLKVIEVPLSKFSEEVVPYYQKAYEDHKIVIHKLISLNNVEQLRREVRDKKRVIKQLRNLMYELDTLRTQVEDEDLDKFDAKTVALRKIIITLIQKYTELEKNADKVVNPMVEEVEEKENCNPFEGASQIQVQGTLEDLKIQHKNQQLNKVEGIHQDVQDLHEMFRDLNDIVGVQGDKVNTAEKTVESAHRNVESGTRALARAHRLKEVAYPITGAFLGGIIGGPIGLVAGIKVGGIAAIGCAIAGYTGGRWFNKMHAVDDMEVDREQQTVNPVSNSSALKKDI